MCGVAGIINFKRRELDQHSLGLMTERLKHRGPDDFGHFQDGMVRLGFRRLSIVDLELGNQPLYNEDKSIIIICNGEVFGHTEIRKDLIRKGHRFRTKSDIEVILHLYEEQGVDFLDKLNGQFAFILYDKVKQCVFVARDHVGIAPLFYYQYDDVFYFSSEIKGFLNLKNFSPRVNLRGLDQVLTFPSIVSPTTLFQDVQSLPPGHFMILSKDKVNIVQYWDMTYPTEEDETKNFSESDYLEELDEILKISVAQRLEADVPVGLYLSGGLDSSLIASYAHIAKPNVKKYSFSVTFDDLTIDERYYQRLVAEQFNTNHKEVNFGVSEILATLKESVFHAETPLKESYNTCSLALSSLARNSGIKTVLSGEGADELFAGYVGYRFDYQRKETSDQLQDLEEIMESDYRNRLWGDRNFLYEKNYYEYEQNKKALYSTDVLSQFNNFNSLFKSPINKASIKNVSRIHRRSYIDLKLRMPDHLLGGHGDRSGLANSVELRYPFLDLQLLEFMKRVPSNLKLKDLKEKYLLKKCGQKYVPNEIWKREKFSFVAPGSPTLLNKNVEWINDILSSETIKRQGYFNPEVVERLRKRYNSEGFKINQTFEFDYLMVVLTFGIFLETFKMPNYTD